MPVLPLGQRMMRSHLADCLSHMGFERHGVQRLMDFQKHNRLISSTEAYLFGWDLLMTYCWLLGTQTFVYWSEFALDWLSEESCWYGCLACKSAFSEVNYWWTEQVKTWFQWLLAMLQINESFPKFVGTFRFSNLIFHTSTIF